MDSLIRSNVLEQLDIIVVNDGSKDHTAEIVQKYVEKYGNSIRLINKKMEDMLFVLILASINVNKQHKFMTCIATFMYPLAAASVILASLKYKSSAIISAFNVMVNYRLKFNLQGFEQYGVNLLGQRIKSNQEYIDQNFVNHYFI